jgi:hypothetical protein
MRYIRNEGIGICVGSIWIVIPIPLIIGSGLIALGVLLMSIAQGVAP